MIHLLFPPICLHCEEKADALFCQGCAAHFELIDPFSRCAFCFAENEGRRPCPECVQKRRWQIKMASALDYTPPVQTMIKKFKYGGMPYLAKTAAAFMFMQFERLEWEPPDIVIPVPRRLWFQGANHAGLLAKAFAKYLRVKVSACIGRRVGDISQARLTQKQREQLESNFYLKRGADIAGKTLLLIDDVMTTGTTLRHTAETLKDGFPKKIYALTCARTIY